VNLRYIGVMESPNSELSRNIQYFGSRVRAHVLDLILFSWALELLYGLQIIRPGVSYKSFCPAETQSSVHHGNSVGPPPASMVDFTKCDDVIQCDLIPEFDGYRPA
jgi:hypothetical protein